MLWSMWRQGNGNIGLINQAMVQLSKTYMGRLAYLESSTNKVYPIQYLSDKIGVEIKAIKILNNGVLLEDSHSDILGVLVKVDNKGKVIAKSIAEDFTKTQAGIQLYKEAVQLQKEDIEQSKVTAKHMIYTSSLYKSEEDIKQEILVSFTKEEMEEMGIDLEDSSSLWEYARDEIDRWFEDEKSNLPKTPLFIVAIADLGLWNGRKTAYAEYKDCSISDLMEHLYGRSIEDVDFYVEGNELKATQYHHDGKNQITYREVTNINGWQKVKEKLYNQEKVTKEEIQRCTKSLKPYVAKVYGWR